MLARVTHELRGCVEAHRLRIEDRGKEHAELMQLLAVTLENEGRFSQAVGEDSTALFASTELQHIYWHRVPLPSNDSLIQLMTNAFWFSQNKRPLPPTSTYTFCSAPAKSTRNPVNPFQAALSSFSQVT